MRSRILLTAISCLLVSACAVSKPKVAGSDSRVKVEQWIGSQNAGMQASKKPVSLKIPIVDFGDMPAAFGKPKWSTAPGGQYEVGYDENVKTPAGECYSISVFGCEKPAPVLGDACSVFEPGLPGKLDESPRSWAGVEVPGLNRNLRYQLTTAAFGDSNDTWQTEPFTVTTPDGKTGSYQATAECENAKVAATLFSKLRVR
jgi:hypothetical protein